jgi:hypothetical protein
MANSNEKEAFDQSFEFFERQEVSEDHGDPWSQPETKWETNAVFDTSFESDPFEFSAVSSAARPTERDSPSHFFPDDPFASKDSSSILKGLVTVPVAIHEQLSTLYDNVSAEGSVCVEGSVYVKPLGELTAPFCLVFRDLLEHVERIEEKSEVCRNITEKTPPKGLHRTDRVLRVTPPPSSVSKEIAILNYVCVQNLRPVPIVSRNSRGWF